MELQAGYPDSPMEVEDATFPCKGCGEVWSVLQDVHDRRLGSKEKPALTLALLALILDS